MQEESAAQNMAIAEQAMLIATAIRFGDLRHVTALLEVAMVIRAPMIMSAVHSMGIVVWVHLIATLNRSGALSVQISNMAAGAFS